MSNSDPENISNDSISEADITDLDPQPATDTHKEGTTSQRSVLSPRVRIWMGIALLVCLVLLATIILKNMVQPQETKIVTKLAPLITYPVSLSVAGNICYARSANGTVTALRISNGSLLWRHVDSNAGEGAVVAANGIIYVAPFNMSAKTVTIEALRATDGSHLWSHTLPTNTSTALTLTLADGVIYTSSTTTGIEALQANDGSLLWQFVSSTPLLSPLQVIDGILYVRTQNNSVIALQASNGHQLWIYTASLSLNSDAITNGMVFLSLHDGSVVALDARGGSVLWHTTLPIHTTQVLPPLLVANDVVYTGTQDGQFFALRTSDGSIVWHVTIHTAGLVPTIRMEDGTIYTTAVDGSIDALRASDGHTLWHYSSSNTTGVPPELTIAQNEIYLAIAGGGGGGINSFASVTVLRTSNGSVLWRFTSNPPISQVLPIMDQNLALIALQDGSVVARNASSGSSLWQQVIMS